MKNPRKKIVFRCDGSSEVGLGHLIRSLAVAKELQERNKIIFASTIDQTNSYIKEYDFEIFSKNDNENEETFLTRAITKLHPNVLFIDKKYSYESVFLNKLKKNNVKIIMMDNLCEGLPACDEIVFHNLYVDENLLKEYLPQEKIAHVKMGPKYIILRNEILSLKNKIERDLHNPPNIIVTTGGSDPKGVLIKIIKWLKEINLPANIYLLVGHAFKFKNQLDEI